VLLGVHKINVATSWLDKCAFWSRIEEAATNDKSLFKRANTSRWTVAKLVFFGPSCKKSVNAIKKVVERSMKCFRYEELHGYIAQLDEHAGMSLNMLDNIHTLYTKHENNWPLFRDGKLGLSEALKQAEKQLQTAEEVLATADKEGNTKAFKQVDTGEALDNCQAVIEWADKEEQEMLYITLSAVGLHKKSIVLDKDDLKAVLSLTAMKLRQEIDVFEIDEKLAQDAVREEVSNA